jgi:hypothetical protein
VERCKFAPPESEAGPLANCVAYARYTRRILELLAERVTKTLATSHGPTYYGDGAHTLRDLATLMRDVLGPQAEGCETTSSGIIQS